MLYDCMCHWHSTKELGCQQAGGGRKAVWVAKQCGLQSSVGWNRSRVAVVDFTIQSGPVALDSALPWGNGIQIRVAPCEDCCSFNVFDRASLKNSCGSVRRGDSAALLRPLLSRWRVRPLLKRSSEDASPGDLAVEARGSSPSMRTKTAGRAAFIFMGSCFRVEGRFLRAGGDVR